MKKLVVGLGNPGRGYAKNRHNVGFMVLDRFAVARGLSFGAAAESVQLRYNGNILLKPLTYMNLSGRAVQKVVKYNDIEDIMVISDDIYLPLGEIRLRENGSHGGHNGLKSIISLLGETPFKRMRLGVGEPTDKALEDYVLSDFKKTEAEDLEHMLQFAENLLDVFLQADFKEMMNYYGKQKPSYSEKNQRPKEERC